MPDTPNISAIPAMASIGIERPPRGVETEMDCPECKGRGCYRVYRAHTDEHVLGSLCIHCGFAPPAPPRETSGTFSTDDLAAQAGAAQSFGQKHAYPVHTGSGWYMLSDGQKVRGPDKAQPLQDALDAAATEPHPEPHDLEPTLFEDDSPVPKPEPFDPSLLENH